MDGWMYHRVGPTRWGEVYMEHLALLKRKGERITKEQVGCWLGSK